MQNIFLVPVDGSEQCLTAVDHAVEAALVSGYAIQLLNVQPRIHTQYAQTKVGKKTLESYKKETSDRILYQAEARTKGRVEVVCKTRWGIPAEEICEEARGIAVKGIFLAPRKPNKKLGSVTYKVLQKSTVPVTVIPV
ncbi:universal stress protein [Sediminibacillus halophilus]|uniref:Nucleotide-binding universal stress protein, UspA family n=1 Tax=Sediminibacillus halophilus TaxID=482461 RepID=A0A1G9N225_9BACI|nr:universal stress protein [Sediminibacillus halophilus]SDL80434.1 Nucleotide-binding universal stress protein, UspA family [Sediminibacillus halophilus]